MSYKYFPFGSGNARNKYFWIFVLVAIFVVLLMLVKKSGYMTGAGDSKNVVNDMSLHYKPLQNEMDITGQMDKDLTGSSVLA